MNKKLSLNIRKHKDGELYNYAMYIVHCLTDNEHFPGVAPLLDPIRETGDQFQKAIYDASNGDILKISIKNDLREKLILLLRELGEWIQKRSNGAETPLVTSGFLIAKPKDEIELAEPTDFQILPGKNNGEIIMRVKRVIGAKAYLFQYTPEPLTPESKWENIYSTTCKKTITNLPLGVKYLFRMAAIGPRDQIVYTNILTRYIA
jgi:hypothetical protein